MNQKLTTNEVALVMVALESLAEEPGYLPQDDIDRLLNLRDDFAGKTVSLDSSRR